MKISIVITSFFIASAAWSALNIIQCQNHEDTSATQHTSFTTSMTTTKGNLLIGLVREGTNNTDNFTMGDDKNQSWIQTPGGYFVDMGAVTRRAGMFYMPESSAITLSTVSFTTGGGGPSLISMIVCEVGGASISNTFDADVVGNSVSGTTYTSGSLTTTNLNDLLFLGIETGGAVTSFTAGTNYTIPTNGGNLTRIAIEYRIVSAKQSGTTTTMTWTTSQASSGDFASFTQLSPQMKGMQIKGAKVTVK